MQGMYYPSGTPTLSPTAGQQPAQVAIDETRALKVSVVSGGGTGGDVTISPDTFTDWIEYASIPGGGLSTVHPSQPSTQTIRGVLFRGTGFFISTPNYVGAAQRTLTITETSEFHSVTPATISASTTALPLVVYYGAAQ